MNCKARDVSVITDPISVLASQSSRPLTGGWRFPTAVGLAAVFLVVVGSQLGMIFLSLVYSAQGRSILTGTPELLFGTGAILLSVLLFSWCRIRLPKVPYAQYVLVLFIAFVLTATICEVFQPNFNWRSITSLLSLLAYLIIGYSCGYVLGDHDIRKILPLVLFLFVIWYASLAWLGFAGHLTAQKILTGATLSRLETSGGFTATELPIYAGMQLPMVLMILFGAFRFRAKVTAAIVLVGISLLLILTASVGAIGASILVLAVFLLYGSRRARRNAISFITVTMGLAALIGGTYLFELYFSIVYKLDRLSIGGGRAEIYSSVVEAAFENPIIGVGLSNFQHLNSFGRAGKGIYPHNNILGIAAELGLFTSALYLIFILMFAWTCVRMIPRLRRSGYGDQAAMLTCIFGIFVFQQFRGLLQDTWLIKEMYFWIGFALGLIAMDRLPIARVTSGFMVGNSASQSK